MQLIYIIVALVGLYFIYIYMKDRIGMENIINIAIGTIALAIIISVEGTWYAIRGVLSVIVVVTLYRALIEIFGISFKPKKGHGTVGFIAKKPEKS